MQEAATTSTCWGCVISQTPMGTMLSPKVLQHSAEKICELEVKKLVEQVTKTRINFC